MSFLYPFSNFILFYFFMLNSILSHLIILSLDCDIRGRMERLYDKVLTTNGSTGERGGGRRDVICLTLP